MRDYLNGSGRKDDFTELQGYVYGSRMDLVAPYAGVAEFFERARAGGARGVRDQPQDEDADPRPGLRHARGSARVPQGAGADRRGATRISR